MILYVNGAEHTSAVRARHHFTYADDDPRFIYMGKQPHPENLELGFARRLNTVLKTSILNEARPYVSNSYIMRTTRAYLEKNKLSKEKQFILIHWAPFDRDEFLIDNRYYPVCASMDLEIPKSLEKKYKRFKRTYDEEQTQKYWHHQFWLLHKELKENNIPHLFAMESSSLGLLKRKHNWGDNFIDPYTMDSSMLGITSKILNPDGHGFFQEKGHLRYMSHIIPTCVKLVS